MKMMKMPGMYSCHDVQELVTCGTVEELGAWDRLRFRMHLMMCHHCARFVRQVRSLGDAVRRLLGAPPDPERVQRLEEAVMAHCDGPDR
ncbi:anti-sigma factor [bacterium]|nr:anti-sigma factor [bacterium]